MHTNIEAPYQIFISNDPFDNAITMDASITGNHVTLGLSTKKDKIIETRSQLLECNIFTPIANIN